MQRHVSRPNLHKVILIPINFRVHSFGVIWIRISDPRSLGSLCITGTNESTLVSDSSLPLMNHDPIDLGSRILIQITPKECTLRLQL